MRIRGILSVLLLALLAAVVAACGGGGGLSGNDDDDGSTPPPTGPTAALLELRTDITSLGSAPGRIANLTAVAKDSSNNLVQGVEISFSATSGDLAVLNATTNAAGQATATLSAGSNPSNRTITVTARTGSVSTQLQIEVTGTTINVSGASSIALGESQVYTVRLTDSEGDPIVGKVVSLTSAAGNTLSASSLTTNSNGQVQVTLTAVSSGTDTLTASAQGATAQKSIAISGDALRFITPAQNVEVNINTPQSITVEWTKNGTPQTAQTLTFTATRGTLSAASAVTDGSGRAGVSITSSTAGPGVITVTNPEGLQATLSLEFVATSVAQVILQGSPSVVSPGGSVALTATVRDANNNLVKNKLVTFSIVQDTTGGSLSVSGDTTDSFGSASSTFTAGNTTGPNQGVIIRATVEGVSDDVDLTVGGRALRVILGTGNTLSEDATQTQYIKPWVVQVTDAQGNAVGGATVNISWDGVAFKKGQWIPDVVNEVWIHSPTNITCPDEDNGGTTGVAIYENDGIIQGDEDVDGDGVLEPGNPASTPATIQTDDNGFGYFNLTYPQNYATWAVGTLSARVSVSGDQYQSSITEPLSILADDIDDLDVVPPGHYSPYGTTLDCTNPL